MDRDRPLEASTGGAHELLPYASMPYATTQPARLAAIAALHGVDAPAIESARVLELGCAGGGNIIPLAARFPRANFLGIDLAQRHIADGAARIAALGLSNIELVQADINDAPLRGPFDYILCHGVFSWVPPAAQDGIFRVCQTHLSDTGLAVVSFNVFPGWHLRMAIRDLCLRHAGEDDVAPMAQVARVRASLSGIAANANPKDPYGALLRKEADRIKHRPASYIMGEFLAAHNAPCHILEFGARAKAFDLAYLCEADLEAAVPESLNAIVRHGTGGNSINDLSHEQYVDDVTGRTFRSAVLTRANVVCRPFDRTELRRLHLSADIVHVDAQSGAAQAFKDSSGRAIRTADASVAVALRRLAAAYPDTVSFAELVAEMRADADVQARLLTALSLLVRTGQVEALSYPNKVGTASMPRPRLWPLARLEAADGQPWITSQTHVPVMVQPLTAFLAKHLDGVNDREALKRLLANGLGRREVNVSEASEAVTDEDLGQIATTYLGRLIDHLARNALLSAD